MKYFLLLALAVTLGCSEDPCPGGRFAEFPDAGVAVCWQENPTSVEYTAEEAHKYCHDLTADGYSDWHTPHYRAYEYMLDGCDPDTSTCYSCAESLMCSQVFGNDEGCYWAVGYGNEPGMEATGGTQYMFVCLGTGEIIGDPPDGIALPVQCARIIAID